VGASVLRSFLAVSALAWLIVAAPAQAQSDQRPSRGSVPEWVIEAEADPVASDPGDAALRIPLLDTQVHATGEAVHLYRRFQTQALTPQTLPLLGNVALAWSPASQTVTVHHVTLLRDGTAIDLLADQDFEILRREENLDQSMLDGQVTAVLQPQGLRVGDIIDTAYTITSRDPVLGGHFESALSLNLPARLERARFRASWPADQPVRSRASGDWTTLRPRRQGDRQIIDVDVGPLEYVPVPEDAPGRVADVRTIELTSYRDWSDIAVALKPLYDRARSLQPGSPLLVEIERIRALSDDPAVRAAAALRLVQDQVRYVALVMGEGALTPASADETWTRRFGDCKAKTALLLALLDGLGIPAEPAAVSLLNGDGLSDRLPRVGAFDHVLVRVQLDQGVFWLDGTRTGDRALADIIVPPVDWALPLTGRQATLERLTTAPVERPQSELAVEIDASAGIYVPSDLTGTMTYTGDLATLVSTALGLVGPAQREQFLRGVWAEELPDADIAEVASSHDADANVVTITARGKIALDWTEAGLIPPAGSYQPVAFTQREDGPLRDAPFVVLHPIHTRRSSTVILPNDGDGFRVSGGVVDRAESGRHIRREVALAEGRVTVRTSIRSLVDEITAEEAERDRLAADARPYDPPRVFVPTEYRLTQADREVLDGITPETAGDWLDRAYALQGTGDWAGAFAAADRAVELAPEESAAWANRGVYRFHMGDIEGARADLDKAVDLDPSERIAMNGHALIAQVEGRHEDAVIELSRALRQKPGDQFALERRAQSYVRLGEFDRAIRDADALIAVNPDNLPWKTFRVLILERAGRTEEVDRDIQALRTEHPGDEMVPINHATILLGRDLAQEALDAIEEAPEEVFDEPSSLLLRGRIRMRMGLHDLAASDFDRVRELSPGDARSLNEMCWSAALAGMMLEQALKDCDAALAISPRSAAYLDSRARVLLQMGDVAGALADYEAALEVAPRQAASLYGRGLARIALGQTEAGEADKAAAIEIAPSVVESFESYSPPPAAAP
jgi:tetratricopeptide (TPR) repeat protein